MRDPVETARQFLFVREAEIQNTGQRVEAIQHWSGGVRGMSWCAFFATMVLDIAFQGNAPLPRTGLCEDLHQLAQQRDWLVDLAHALPGDLFLYLDATGHAHHVGMLTEQNATSPTGWFGIAGNTSADGTSSNGNGVYEHALFRPSLGSLAIIQYPRG